MHAGYQDIEDIEPITVAAYIETLQRHSINVYWQAADFDLPAVPAMAPAGWRR